MPYTLSDSLWLSLLVALLLLSPACSDDGETSSFPDAAGDALHDVGSDSAVDVVDDAVGGDGEEGEDTAGGDADEDATDVGDADDADTGTAPQTDPVPLGLWPERPRTELSGPFYESHPAAFARISRWATHVVAPDTPQTNALGAFGVGNGRVFGIIGMTLPLSTLHGLVGPTYEKPGRFFADYEVRLTDAAGESLPVEEQWAARSLSAPVAISRAAIDGWELDTVVFAPWTEDEVARDCMLRVLIVRRSTDADGDAPLIEVTARSAASSPDGRSLVQTAGERAVITRIHDQAPTVRGRTLAIEIDDLGGGEEQTYLLSHCTQLGDTLQDQPSFDVGALLDETATAYQRWEQELLQIDVPDPMVADLIDGMKMTLAVQTTHDGATCPMSGYTRTWARDNIGPVLAMLAYGGHDDVRAMMDYIYNAVVLLGDLRNSYDADLDFSDLPAPPDWDSLPTFPERVAAETPSYMVWIYGAWYEHTGDLSLAEERWGFLRRSMFAQDFGPGRLLPFTGDETFRAAMNAAFGLELEAPHHETSWSANSALLWLGASQHFIRMAEALGHTDDAERARAIADEMEETFRARYVREDGCVGAFIDRSTDELSPIFEDASLKTTWAGWSDGDDEVAQRALACLLEEIEVVPGIVQSPLDPLYAGVPILPAQTGVFTGMLPGYALAAYTDTGHPHAEHSFGAMERAALTSGNYQEYMVFDDFKGFSLVYDPSGAAQDYTAKFRPWEGGINIDAVLGYLVGFAPNVPSGRIDLRPHLPTGWDTASYEGLRYGDARFDVQLARAGAGARVTVQSHADEPVEVRLRWDFAPGASLGSASIDSEPVERDEIATHEHFGATSIELPETLLEGGRSLVFLIE